MKSDKFTGKLILWRAKLLLDVVCPRCKSMDVKGVIIVETQCKNCQARFTANAGVNIYGSVARPLIKLLAKYNDIVLVGERDPSNTFTADQVFSPKSKHEDDIIHTLLAIRKDFVDIRCFDVSEITNSTDTDWKTRCSSCGTCKDCVTCQNCKTTYKPKEIKTKFSKEKRFTCPECNSKKYRQTHIKKFEQKNVCPHCKSTNTTISKFPSHLKKCPYCNEKKTISPRKVPIYKLTISHQPRNRLKE